MTLPSKNQDASMLQIASHLETEESRISEQKETVLLSNQGTRFERFIDVANTLMARDYKGFGNKGMNGVIERNDKQDMH